MLTKQQIELVKATVPVLREHGVALTSHFYKSELLGVAYTQIRNPDSNLSLLGRS